MCVLVLIPKDWCYLAHHQVFFDKIPTISFPYKENSIHLSFGIMLSFPSTSLIYQLWNSNNFILNVEWMSFHVQGQVLLQHCEQNYFLEFRVGWTARKVNPLTLVHCIQTVWKTQKLLTIEKTPDTVQTIKAILTLPVYMSTPVGDTKMPLPIIDPTITVHPFSKLIFAFNPTSSPPPLSCPLPLLAFSFETVFSVSIMTFLLSVCFSRKPKIKGRCNQIDFHWFSSMSSFHRHTTPINEHLKDISFC